MITVISSTRYSNHRANQQIWFPTVFSKATKTRRRFKFNAPNMVFKLPKTMRSGEKMNYSTRPVQNVEQLRQNSPRQSTLLSILNQIREFISLILCGKKKIKIHSTRFKEEPSEREHTRFSRTTHSKISGFQIIHTPVFSNIISVFRQLDSENSQAPYYQPYY